MPQRSDSSLEDLLEQYRDGNLQAFEMFFRKTKNIVHTYVIRRMNNSETAEDITQEIYLRIHRYVISYDRSKGNATSWIRSIAHNSISDHFSHLKSRQIPPQARYFLEANAPDNLNDRMFYEDMIYQFQGHLDAGELEILIERLVADSSFKEIGNKHGIRTDHARQKFGRIIKKIKKLID